MTHVETLVIEGVLTPNQMLTYPMLPFTVPRGTVHIAVRYSYAGAIGSDPHLTGGNTVDIGLFDARGHTFMSEGFRGWSGSARTEFFISTEAATPGYMPGPIQPGEWHICLGAYKVAAAGCPYRVEIALTQDETAPDAEFPVRLGLSALPREDVFRESGWYKGELHCHSVHSDGDSDPRIVIERAEALGLDFLAIMDHNVLSHQVALASADTRLILIPGLEVTTYRGHWNIWGAGPWIDFRVLDETDMQAAVNAALEADYLISCNHPRPFGPDWEYTGVEGFQCIEVWNGPWPLMNDTALAYWEARLRQGARISAVGGSDCHFHTGEHHAKLANPTTFIYCAEAPSAAAILAGLQAGHAFISESPAGPEITLAAGDVIMGDVLTVTNDRVALTLRVRHGEGKQVQIITNEGVIKQFELDSPDWLGIVEADVSRTPYVRAQVVSEPDNQPLIHALTNPLYIRHDTRQG